MKAQSPYLLAGNSGSVFVVMFSLCVLQECKLLGEGSEIRIFQNLNLGTFELFSSSKFMLWKALKCQAKFRYNSLHNRKPNLKEKQSTCRDVSLYISVKFYLQTYGKYSTLFSDQSPKIQPLSLTFSGVCILLLIVNKFYFK